MSISNMDCIWNITAIVQGLFLFSKSVSVMFVHLPAVHLSMSIKKKKNLQSHLPDRVPELCTGYTGGCVLTVTDAGVAKIRRVVVSLF